MDLETALLTLDLLVQDKAINDAVRKECTDLILARIKNSTRRRCSVCGCTFVVMPPHTRSTREYCSEACSAKAYRKRRDALEKEAS